jgi:hypothetical protein
MSKVSLVFYTWIAVVLTLLLIAVVSRDFNATSSGHLPKFNTPYEAVLLDNGQVYYGHLTGLGTPFPKMTDMYYVVTTSDPQTKQTKPVLVKRGKELHAPTETFLDARHIIMIENVGQQSRIAQLIQQSESGTPPPENAPAPSSH